MKKRSFFSKLFGKKSSPKKKVIKKIAKKKKIPKKTPKTALSRPEKNPIISPNPENEWEAYQTFNPAAILTDGKVHLLYRALGPDGVSRLGYAASEDGLHFPERSPRPAYVVHKRPGPSTAYLSHGMFAYASGGTWAGCEDPRITKIGDTIYMLYVAFDYVGLPRLAITSIKEKDFLAQNWKWAGARIISPPGLIDKSGVVFPEKIKGKYVIMHRIFPNILIDFVDSLDFKKDTYLQGKYSIKIRKNMWDSRKIGAGAPPLKTKYGWLLIYYAVDDRNDSQYKIGAMLLSLKDPRKVLYRTDEPILEPIHWYENEGDKFGVTYPCGAVVKDKKLLVYYGGSDSYVCVAYTNLNNFLKELMKTKKPKLSKVRKKKK